MSKNLMNLGYQSTNRKTSYPKGIKFWASWDKFSKGKGYKRIPKGINIFGFDIHLQII